LLIDDNASVLDSAARFGIAHLFTIAQPDSQRPPRTDLKHRVIDDFRQLMAEPTVNHNRTEPHER
jgi:putative hydrolase of the HAD superfamily